jgi:hypothetical protein
MTLKYKIIIIFVLSAGCVMAQTSFSVHTEKQSVASVLLEAESKSGFLFYYNQAELDTVTVSLNRDFSSVEEFLESIEALTGLHFLIDNHKNVFISRYAFTKPPVADTYSPLVKIEERDLPKQVANDAEDALLTRENSRGNKVYQIGDKKTFVSGTTVLLKGYIKSTEGKPVVGASIRFEKLEGGTVTGADGSYSISLPRGKHRMTVKSVGMQDAVRQLIVDGNGTLDVEMQIQTTNLKEIVVEADETSNVRSVTLGVEKIDIAEIKNVPTVFGESDVIKVVLTLPGVKSVGEASTGFNVRGGAGDQNLILYNDATIFNPSHFFGFFSAFNPETVKDVELYKSSMPARYGGRLSSVLQVTGKEGNGEKLSGSAGIGLLTCRFNVEGPLIKDKTTFIAGGRTTYSNALFKLMPENSGYRNTRASFSDVNLNVHHRIGLRDHVSATGYLSNDESNLNTDTLYQYRNRNIAVKWRHVFGQDLEMSISLARDHYSYENHSDADSLYAYKMRFRLNQNVFRANFNFTPGNRHAIEFGLNATHYQIGPSQFERNHSSSLIQPVAVDKEQGLESALYLEDQFKISKNLSLNAGLRYSVFNYLGPQQIRIYPAGIPKTEETIIDTIAYEKNEIIRTYHGLDYRLSARYAITESFSLKIGYSTARQFLHMLSNTIAIAPTDTWKLSDSNIKPQQSTQISVGIYKNFYDNALELSLEGYSKRIRNYLDYKSGANFLVNTHVETEVFRTRGKAYGVELMLRKPKGNFNGWMSYTYARTLLQIDDREAGETINHGEYYPASYDKPHDFTFVGNQKLSRRFSISFNFTYSTGRPVTIPVGIFFYGGTQKTLYSDRNGYRIPDYFRTDFSLNILGNHKIKQLTHNSWTIGIYNLTGRKNPYSVYFISEAGTVKGYKLSIFGAMIPFINYNIRF